MCSTNRWEVNLYFNGYIIFAWKIIRNVRTYFEADVCIRFTSVVLNESITLMTTG